MTMPPIPPLQFKILQRLDVEAAVGLSRVIPPGGLKDNGKHADTRETVLAGMHKLRVGHPEFSAAEKAISCEWLTANGWRVPV